MCLEIGEYINYINLGIANQRFRGIVDLATKLGCLFLDRTPGTVPQSFNSTPDVSAMPSACRRNITSSKKSNFNILMVEMEHSKPVSTRNKKNNCANEILNNLEF